MSPVSAILYVTQKINDFIIVIHYYIRNFLFSDPQRQSITLGGVLLVPGPGDGGQMRAACWMSVQTKQTEKCRNRNKQVHVHNY